MILQPALPEIPLVLIAADQISIDDVEPGQGTEKSRERLEQIDGNTPLVEHLGTAHRRMVARDPDLQGQHSVDRVLDVLGKYRRAVVKNRVLAHIEDVAPGVF